MAVAQAFVPVLFWFAAAAFSVGVQGHRADELMARVLAVNAQDNEGWSPLLKVLNLWADQPALVEYLFAHGADATARLKDGRSGLMLAAQLRKVERLPPLIAHGSRGNARNNNGGEYGFADCCAARV